MTCIRRTLPPFGVVLCCALLVACADDTVPMASMSGSGSGSGSTSGIAPGTISLDDTGLDTTAVGTADGSGTGSTGSAGSTTDAETETDTDTTDTGDPVESGHPGGAFVNAGSHELSGSGFRLIFTFGQASHNQNTMTSPGHRLRGGFVPATQ